MKAVVACGNTLRADDGVGARAAALLGDCGPGVRVFVEQQLMPETAALLAGVDHVVFIDACLGVNPGEIRVREIQSLPQPQPFSHVLDPAQLLEMAALVSGRRPCGTLITVTGRDFEFGEELSAEVQAALPAVVATIRHEL